MAVKHVIKISNIIRFFKDEDEVITCGENAVQSRHVINMVFDEPLRTLKGSVLADNCDKQYDAEIHFNSDWSIEKALCSCLKGRYRCQHMAAVALFGHYKVSLTRKTCLRKAQKPLKDDEVKIVSNISPTKKRRSTQRKATNDEIENITQRLQVVDLAVGIPCSSSKEIAAFSDSILIHIEDIIFTDEFINNPNQKEYFQNKVKIDAATILEVSKKTIGQNKNEHWFKFRENRITASNFGVILSACRRKSFPPSLFKRLAGTYNIDNLRAIKWGRDHEKEALDSFEKSTNMKVIPTGLWLHECGYLGASPDGLVNEDAIIEAKCPYKYREMSLLEGIKNNKNYIIVSDSNGNVRVNKNHEYFQQIQGQLAITKRRFCHLIVWTPKEAITVNIEAEDYTHNIELLNEFYLNRFLPFLIGKRVI